MNDILIRSAQLVLPGHRYHGKEIDILIENGRVVGLEQKNRIPTKDVKIINAEGDYVSIGFFDLNTNIGEPGQETKEDIKTGTAAAAAGGFTGIAVQPNTTPAIYTRSEVSLIVNAAKDNLVDVHPIGCISKKREGEELAELYDMKLSGAIAFSDGNRAVQQAGLMSRALLYSKGFGGLVLSFAQDDSLSAGCLMNEGSVSTYLGMKGTPNLAEALMVSRDLFLTEYNDARIHFSTISTAESVKLIREAKANGLRVTCDVAAHTLVFTDHEVEGFDSNFKVNPPLRTKDDIEALLMGLREGVIDAIVTQHTPHEVEFKNVEFQIAKNGMTGLQTALPMLIKAGLAVEEIVDKLAISPRKVIGLPVPQIEIEEKANLVVFSMKENWSFDAETNKSKGSNNPWYGKLLTGKVKMVINNNQMIINK